jgi:DNA repair protein RadC
MPEETSRPNPAEGHRGRLRERFMQGGLDAFLDYEIIELLLTLGTPRKNCKQMAKEVVQKFGGLREALDAPIEELQQIKGIGQINAFGLKLFQAISERYAKEQMPKKISFDSPETVAHYLQKFIGSKKKEHFVVLSLDTCNNLKKISNISIGSLNESIAHPREIFQPAIQNSCSYVIIAHNHPSGSLEPSDEDLHLTKRLVTAGRLIGINVIDHIIVTKSGFFSFKERNLM